MRGASLIEVLIAVIVLSIGLLGLAGLQMTSLQSQHSAYLRSQASLLAYDLTDRMRAARRVALDGAYDDGGDGDRENWDDNVTALLGAEARGGVTRSGADVAVTIEWNDNRGRVKAGGDTGTTSMQSFVYRTEI